MVVYILSLDEIEPVSPLVSCHRQGHGCFKVAYLGVNKRVFHSQSENIIIRHSICVVLESIINTFMYFMSWLKWVWKSLVKSQFWKWLYAIYCENTRQWFLDLLDLTPFECGKDFIGFEENCSLPWLLASYEFRCVLWINQIGRSYFAGNDKLHPLYITSVIQAYEVCA